MKLPAAILLLTLPVLAGTGNRVPAGSGTVGLQPVIIPAVTKGAHDFTFKYPATARLYAWTLQTQMPIRSQQWATVQTWPRGLQPAGTMNIPSSPFQKYRMAGN
jgi:hypothetical protein